MELDNKQLEVLLLYAGRAITRADAAKRLGVTERQVNRCMAQVSLERAVSSSKIARTKTEKHRIAREQAALAVSQGKITEKQAAARAGCSARTIYRYLEKLK